MTDLTSDAITLRAEHPARAAADQAAANAYATNVAHAQGWADQLADVLAMLDRGLA